MMVKKGSIFIHQGTEWSSLNALKESTTHIERQIQEIKFQFIGIGQIIYKPSLLLKKYNNKEIFIKYLKY